jgi:cell division septum initiation protein DivIVA
MNENGIEEIISTLYEMVQDARGVPLSSEKCVIERDRVLDLLDEISNQLPGELKQAKTIVESRGEVINNAKREAENILKQAQAQARQMVSENEIYKQAQEEANAMVKAAQDRIRELKGVTNDYVDDALKQTEQAIAEALNEVKESRAKFNALVGAQNKAAKPASNPAIIEEV